jgi:hypothetical protein
LSIQKLITPELARLFLNNPNFHVESNGYALLIFTKERLAGTNEIKKMSAFGNELKEII